MSNAEICAGFKLVAESIYNYDNPLSKPSLNIYIYKKKKKKKKKINLNSNEPA